MVVGAEAVARVERVAGRSLAALVGPLGQLDDRLHPTAVPVGGGQLVLLGPGMYVNRGLAFGHGVEITDADLETVEALSERVGVPAEVEVSPWAHPSLLAVAVRRGFQPSGFRTTLLRPVAREAVDRSDVVAVEEVCDDRGLAVWQEVAATGFGYTTTEQRRVSDVYTTAVHRLGESRLYVGRIGSDAVAVAALTIREQVAILGGMTTVPAARGRGVQTDLIRVRLAAAARGGCDIAMVTAAPGSASERNLLRNGFSIAATTLPSGCRPVPLGPVPSASGRPSQDRGHGREALRRDGGLRSRAAPSACPARPPGGGSADCPRGSGRPGSGLRARPLP
ncbi:MAG: hypothetical protein ACLGI3_00575, partial [Actinomycetes bacterium]